MVGVDILFFSWWNCGTLVVVVVVVVKPEQCSSSTTMSDVQKLRVDFKQKIVVQYNRPRVRRIGKSKEEKKKCSCDTSLT